MFAGQGFCKLALNMLQFSIRIKLSDHIITQFNPNWKRGMFICFLDGYSIMCSYFLYELNFDDYDVSWPRLCFRSRETESGVTSFSLSVPDLLSQMRSKTGAKRDVKTQSKYRLSYSAFWKRATGMAGRAPYVLLYFIGNAVDAQL